MTLPSEIRPQDCPEPYWHETHRYCPACSWTENYGKPVKRPITVEVKVPETALTYESGDALILGKGVALALRDYVGVGGDLTTWACSAEGYELAEGTGIRLVVTGLSVNETLPDPVAPRRDGESSDSGSAS